MKKNNQIIKKNKKSWDNQNVFCHLNNELIYYTNFSDYYCCFCIFKNLEKDIFQMTHNELYHASFHQVYNIIVVDIFIWNLSKRLIQYIIHCLQCLSCQIVQHHFYEILQSVVESSISFHTVTVNFIIDLFKTKKEFNIIITVTCKFLKKVKFISEKNTWTTAEWTKIFFNSTTD